MGVPELDPLLMRLFNALKRLIFFCVQCAHGVLSSVLCSMRRIFQIRKFCNLPSSKPLPKPAVNRSDKYLIRYLAESILYHIIPRNRVDFNQTIRDCKVIARAPFPAPTDKPGKTRARRISVLFLSSAHSSAILTSFPVIHTMRPLTSFTICLWNKSQSNRKEAHYDFLSGLPFTTFTVNTTELRKHQETQ
jgi:hypothetical protein